MPLLHLAQAERGWVTGEDIDAIAKALEISRTEVASIIGFYTLYHPEEDQTKYRIQVCTDLACALRGADDFLITLCQMIGIQPGQTTMDGMITIEEVTCLAGCNNAPLFQIQGKGTIGYYENQTPEGAFQVIQEILAKGKVEND